MNHRVGNAMVNKQFAGLKARQSLSREHGCRNIQSRESVDSALARAFSKNWVFSTSIFDHSGCCFY